MKTWNKSALCLAIALVSYHTLAQEGSNVQRGIEAFERGEYAAALENFSAAEQAGIGTESVQYNIAVSLYRLGRLDESEERFLALSGLANWRVLVNYNLGLVNEAQGDNEEARRYFELSVEQQEHDKVRELAGQKLEELDRQEQSIAGIEIAPRSTDRFAGLIEVSGGVDSNASSLADDLLEESDRGEDTFSQLLLYGHGYAFGERNDGLRIHALGYSKSLAEFDHLNSRIVGLGVTWEQPVLGFQTDLGVTVLRTDLDSEKIADQRQINASAWKRFGIGTLKLGLAHTAFNAEGRFAQIDGDQQRIDLSWSKRFDGVSASVRLRHEENDRADLSRNGAFASYSPTRDGIRTKLDWRINSRLALGLQYEHINSVYDGINTLRDIDGSVKSVQRENTRTRWSSELSYRPLSSNWRFSLEYQNGDVEDEYRLYTYDKQLIQISINYEF